MTTYNYGSPITGVLVDTEVDVKIPFSGPISSVILNSAAVGRAIQLSFDYGTTFHDAITPTYTTDDQIVYVLTFPVTDIKFVGEENDTYTILQAIS